eukprot:CAMPEP_0171241376 /NCGR_PEP_ID=MMETSP0790-20130122/45052_1 /TAXON_ID=2925 /ORGANISM="Alexandrium catenella, Strain OF101" /LENGTH=51 /DNA_ID=CAMNT_0011707961 /DNA_START=88 /DNA_END=239 /DNA_ORIENTATION=-
MPLCCPNAGYAPLELNRLSGIDSPACTPCTLAERADGLTKALGELCGVSVG